MQFWLATTISLICPIILFFFAFLGIVILTAIAHINSFNACATYTMLDLNHSATVTPLTLI
jgi:hypothetical protein